MLNHDGSATATARSDADLPRKAGGLVTLTIVSGGQTGADRGAFRAAIQLGLPYGGWAPRGFIAEDGTIPDIYRANMRESSSPNYGMRTRLNVQDSDATLIVSFATELSGGSDFTARIAKQQQKPSKHLVLPIGTGCVPVGLRDAILEWLRDRSVAVLNVAGPRESKEPGIEAAVCKTLVWLFEPAAVRRWRRAQALSDFFVDPNATGPGRDSMLRFEANLSCTVPGWNGIATIDTKDDP